MKKYMKLPKTLAENEVRILARRLLGTPTTKQTHWLIHRGVDFNLFFVDSSFFLVQCLWKGEAWDYFMEEGVEECHGVAELFYQLERGLKAAQKNFFLTDMTWGKFYERNKLQRIEEFGCHTYEFATVGEIRTSDVYYFTRNQKPKEDIEVLANVYPEYTELYVGINGKWMHMKQWDDDKQNVFVTLKEYASDREFYPMDHDDVFFHAKLAMNYKGWKYKLSSIKAVKTVPTIKKPKHAWQ